MIGLAAMTLTLAMTTSPCGALRLRLMTPYYNGMRFRWELQCRKQ